MKLLAATSTSPLSPRLRKIKGREQFYAELWFAEVKERMERGAGATLETIASRMRELPRWKDINRFKVRRGVDVIRALEADGIWKAFTP